MMRHSSLRSFVLGALLAGVCLVAWPMVAQGVVQLGRIPAASSSGTTLTDSASLAAALSNETGTGVVVFATSPTLTTPALGVATATSVDVGDNAYAAGWNGSTLVPTRNAIFDRLTAITQPITFGIAIDGGGSAITTGVKGFARIPATGTITKVTVLSIDASATSGSIVVDVWKDTYANYPPTVADTITASAKPTLSSANKAEDATLTGWTTAVTAGDVVGFNVDSATTVTKVLVSVEMSVP